ncbi:VOC family protein [Flavobacterium sp. P21]|uniref:VOC family protein n=1 Tax=Flavobacterium sp. P21 TaxID=3423948 RepID=UPI003D66AFE7
MNTELCLVELFLQLQSYEQINDFKKVAIKADGNDFNILKKLAVSLCGATEIYDECGLSALLTEDGTLLELYTSYSCFPEYFFKDSNIVITYKVKDIQLALNQAQSLGVKILTEIIPVGDVMRYCHLQLPDGMVIGLYQETAI